MIKHAYLILAHNQIDLLKTLVSLLDDERNDIYIHLDKKYRNEAKIEELHHVCKHSALTLLPDRLSVHWGGKSIIDAEMRLLNASIKGNYAYYHLLSGVDLPLKDQDTIHRFFQQNSGKEFLDIWQLKSSTHTRFNYYTVFPEGEGNLLPRYVNYLVKGILMLLKVRINKDVDFRYGSQWFSITHDFASYIVAQQQWVDKVFAHTSTCDEVFIPTLLYRSPYAENLYSQQDDAGYRIGNMRFIDWSRGTSVRHPYTFTIEDFPLLCQVPHMFARKFNIEQQGDLVAKLAEYVSAKKH